MVANRIDCDVNSKFTSVEMSFEKTFSKEEIYQIGKHLVENGGWIRKDNDDGKYAMLWVKLPYESDLSSVGSRVDSVNKEINKCK